MFFQYGSANSIYLLVELSAGTVPTWMTLAWSLIVVIIRSAIYPEVLHLVNDFLGGVRSQCQQGRQKAHHASGHLIWPLLLTCAHLHSSVWYVHQLHNSVLDPCVTFTELLSMNEQLAGLVYLLRVQPIHYRGDWDHLWEYFLNCVSEYLTVWDGEGIH